ncbi:hypothetical protein FB45DRAFT_1008091 [Roridomyces roridus]|uniref:Mitochondrial splicing suppressor 51-like C-terminal domain-containing protein n=1 Tax=Roridomyces roridus TaxID=1738132 RepID=A0AAD7BC69_9AGAR|nr:hypothetical protein FB45DRAFT_1008091 [Roridomyces roridus]
MEQFPGTRRGAFISGILVQFGLLGVDRIRDLPELPARVWLLRSLTVHYIGAEDELTFLRISGELALLFPNTNLDIIMFGPSKPPDLLYSSIQAQHPVAPEPSAFFWTVTPKSTSLPSSLVIVALHAGLRADSSWHPVIDQAVTDFDERRYVSTLCPAQRISTVGWEIEPSANNACVKVIVPGRAEGSLFRFVHWNTLARLLSFQNIKAAHGCYFARSPETRYSVSECLWIWILGSSPLKSLPLK